MKYTHCEHIAAGYLCLVGTVSLSSQLEEFLRNQFLIETLEAHELHITGAWPHKNELESIKINETDKLKGI